MEKILRKPDWLKIKLPHGVKAAYVANALGHRALNTICTSGMCPNRAECWGNGTATFMIGGDTCTRSCRFCNVKTGRPAPLDPAEPQHVADTIAELKLRHAVVTSVDRDDLPDCGANHWADVIRAIRLTCPGVTLETLLPDFKGKTELLQIVIDRKPDVISHNIETVRRLTPLVRCNATYDRSLAVLSQISQAGIPAKSGLMLGLGETIDEVIQAMHDLFDAGCTIITIGQYLQPTLDHWPVACYVHPSQFEELRLKALEIGFKHAESAPLVRSSYHAERHV